MIKYYLKGNSFIEVEYKPRVSFLVREIPFDSIIKAVTEMTSIKNFFELLSTYSGKIKTYSYGCEEYKDFNDMWYETKDYFSTESFNFRILTYMVQAAYNNTMKGIYAVANRVIENYLRTQLHSDITADIINNKVYPVTNEIFDGQDKYKVEVDFSDNTIKSHKKGKKLPLRIRQCYTTLYDLTEWLSRITEAEIIEKYLKFDIEHPEAHYPVRFYINEEQERVEEIYFNPDSESGSQYVQYVFYFSDILDSLESMKSTYSFFSNIENNCKMYHYDIGDDEYETIKDKYEKEFYDLAEENFFSMLTLVRLALTREFIAKNLNDSDYIGVYRYALYKIAERFLIGYYKDEFPDDYNEKTDSNLPLSVGEKLEIAASSTDIHGVELESTAHLNFSDFTIVTTVAGHEIIRKRFANLKDFVAELEALDFYELTNLGDEEAEKFFEDYPELFLDYTETCPHCDAVNVFVNPIGYVQKCRSCGKDIMLCSKCLDNEPSAICDWRKTANGGECWRSNTVNKENKYAKV